MMSISVACTAFLAKLLMPRLPGSFIHSFEFVKVFRSQHDTSVDFRLAAATFTTELFYDHKLPPTRRVWDKKTRGRVPALYI